MSAAADHPLGDGGVDHPGGPHHDGPGALARVGTHEHEPGEVGEHLRPRPQAQGVPACHPVAVGREAPAPQVGHAQGDARQHGRADDEAFGVHQHAVSCGPGVDERHPEARDGHDECGGHQDPADGAMGRRPGPSESRRELERAQEAEHDGRRDVKGHGQRVLEEPGALGGEGSPSGELGQARGAGDGRHRAQEDEAGRDQPVPLGRAHGRLLPAVQLEAGVATPRRKRRAAVTTRSLPTREVPVPSSGLKPPT